MIDLPALIGAVCCAGFVSGFLLLAVGIRGVRPDPTRPDGRLTRAAASLRAPGMAARLLGALGAAALVLLATRWPVAAAAAAALVALWPHLFGGLRAERTQINRLEALVVWTESLRDMVAAHASLEQAIPAGTENAPPSIRPALVKLSGQIRAHTPLDTALLGLAADLDDPSADLVIAALVLNVQRRGNRLREVLTGLASTARQELDLRRRVSAGRAALRRGVQIIVGFTVTMAVFLVVLGGEYVKPYNTFAGQLALCVVVAIFAAGFAWMRRLSAGERVEPFLARPGQQPAPEDLQLVASLTGVSTAAAASLVQTSPQRLTTGPRLTSPLPAPRGVAQ